MVYGKELWNIWCHVCCNRVFAGISTSILIGIVYLLCYHGDGRIDNLIKKKTKIPRVTDEGWHSQKQLSGPVEKKKEKTLVSSSKAIIDIGLYSKVDVC